MAYTESPKFDTIGILVLRDIIKELKKVNCIADAKNIFLHNNNTKKLLINR